MKVLILDEGKNLISNALKKYLTQENIRFCTLNDITKLSNAITDNNITHVIYDYRRSYGNHIWNTSYIETHLEENLKYNLYYSIQVCNICKNMNVHVTYIGEGCVFSNSNSTEPDLKVSNHSLMNIYTEKILNELYPDILYLRIRYPITADFKPNCHLMKLISFTNILDTDNSITIIEDMMPIMLEMLQKQVKGIFNFFGKHYINSIETIIQLKTFDSLINFKVMTENVHNNKIGKRSNGIFDNTSLETFCNENKLILPSSSQSLINCLNKMKKECLELKYCLCCREINHLLLDLGYQPLANDFHEVNDINSIYPLKLKYCHNCFHCQLSHSVSPEILFKNYKYVSGTSQTGKDFFKWNADFIHNYVGRPGKILDIACNDGSQLNPFKTLGWDTYGVDPAENICPIAEKEGHTIFCDFWNDSVADKLPIMDIITAQNVFAHTPYIDDFLQTCKKVMDTNTSLFIQTSQRDMILNCEFDTTYHEHISFYNTKSMNTLTKRNGLVLNRVLEHSIHGRSYIFEIKLTKDEEIYNVEEQLEIERNLGLYNIYTYEKFRIGAETSISNLKLTVETYKNKGYKIIGFGAAAKGQTFICYGDIELDYIIDENPLKIGSYSPKLNIPIVSLEHFKQDKDEKILVIVLAWNFATEIIEKINNNKGNKDIVVIERYFPIVDIKSLN